MNPNWKSYFYFSTKELKGLTVLGIILLGSVLLSHFFPKIKLNKGPLNGEQKAILFYFDPNKIDSLQAITLGIPSRQVNALLHYRDKGGRFKSKDDFAKLYGLTNEKFQLLRPYITIDETFIQQKYVYRKWPRFENRNKDNGIDVSEKININSTNEQEWIQLTALPIDLIRRIITYKKYLGVYHSTNQLSKVYGMKEEYLIKMSGRMYVKNINNELRNANALSFKDWKELDLFTDQQIWTILRQKKENHGSISWSALVVSCDLTETEANALRRKIQLSD